MATNIKVGHLKITDHLILGITQDKLKKGEEKFSHCSIESKAYIGWNQISNALKDGEIDAAFVLAPTAMDLALSGVDIKLTLFAHKTGSVFVKNKAAGINSVKDLKGKIIVIPFQLSVHHMLLHQLLTEAGLTTGVGKDVTLEVMAPSQMPQAIEFDEDGECAGYIVAEPFGTQAVNGGYAEEFYLSKDLWAKHPCCVVVMKNELIQNHPEAVQELINSLVDSGSIAQNQTERAVAVGVEFLGQSKDVVTKVLTDPPDRVMFNELMPVVEDLAKIQDYMCDKMKLLNGKVDLSKFVDTEFAKSAGAK